MERRNLPIIKLHAAQRYLVWHYLQPFVNNIRVCEFPKSGGTWLSQMLSDLFEIPYPRNSGLPIRKCIQHEHYAGPSKHKTIMVVRDGRDVMTSAYFHFLVANKERPPALLRKWRILMGESDYSDVIGLMPKFIKLFSENYHTGAQQTNWSDHVHSFDLQANNVLMVKYEHLLKDAEKELRRISNWYELKPQKDYHEIVRKYSFKNQSNRENGIEDNESFLRKGIAGDWKNYFNEDAIKTFNALHKDALELLEYV